MTEDMYEIFYKEDEIQLNLSKCKQPWNCTCKTEIDSLPKCGYNPDQAKQKFIEYFQRRVDHLKSISTSQFMRELGYYHYED
jgi:hypothetical protein